MTEANNQTNTNNSEAMGTVGHDVKFVKLISTDGYEFVIPKNEAMKAHMLATMMTGPGQFTEDAENAVNLDCIYSRTLKQIVMYLRFKKRYSNSDKAIPEFPVDSHIACDLLKASHLLGC